MKNLRVTLAGERREVKFWRWLRNWFVFCGFMFFIEIVFRVISGQWNVPDAVQIGRRNLADCGLYIILITCIVVDIYHMMRGK